MEENKDLLKSAMSYGLLLGIFWVIKYVFFILGITMPFMQIIYWVLTPLTVVLALLFTSLYKYQLGGKISFFHAWQYGILLYFFAGLIVSLLHYVFYRYIAPPDLLSSSMEQMVEMMRKMDLNEQMKETIEQMATPTPIQMTIQGIFTNVFYGIILSIPVAALLCRNNFTGLINQNNKKGDNL
ncbi:hypothetical protein M2459_003300 [Parabacteroides sp. PF5-5]|uniref:DUF4199 domain-containing protein n=1 Tax=unclassified Parabacteroides TaxID=2649774 RepID=UPI0024745A4F|nr:MULTISPECIES: DUF4199 domain-containing protein [unclassified Parabacteroides]MDH6306575.1 hypothetical protein [Parabacteroides sp. PH5-39]MDH6317542.1 hypothetical protein [Parabacteroides sp. PF5-13]MDH6321286.1 hypothetical protein [Parabacteroides sp. PH5-13]MDH6325018.1 hypothetical protein [Parabacteroides sp. PH5-8]MDH6328727.1 hypothetical protein [Parabacteroides sp. PH5-41]